MKRTVFAVIGAGIALLAQSTAQAHFGMIIPDSPVIDQQKRSAELTLSFSHPFEQVGMDLERPARFDLFVNGKTTSLLESLKHTSVMGHAAWNTRYSFKRPGVYQFVMEPKPYWEEAEDIFIVHYTKVIIPAYGEENGWQTPTGVKTEIVPRLRPFGNYAGNSFSGKVLMNGKPVPNAEVEVELYNTGHLPPPTPYHITQVVQADEQGNFSFTCPFPGWWGFSALNTSDKTLTGPDGQEKEVELGAVLWIYLDRIEAGN